MINFVEWHAALLKDSPRVAAYARAIAAIVKPGDVVADIGAGTGVMGLLACRAGAARVYAIEGGGMIEILRGIARANGLADRMVCLYGDSQALDLPERVDVAIADQTGPFGIGGGVFALFNDARRRMLKPHGTTIPAQIDLSVALAEHPRGWAAVEFWDGRPLGFEMGAMRDVARNVGYELHFDPAQLLSEPARVLSFRIAESAAAAANGAATLAVRRRGTLHGLFGYFAAELAPGVWIANSPLGPGAIGRRAWYMPIERPLEVEPGDSAAVVVHLMPDEEVAAWTIEVKGRDGAAKAKSAHSTFKGTLIAKEDLRRMLPGYVPELSRRGEIERAILELCDGKRAAREIAAALRLRFPADLHSDADAEAAVSRSLGRSAR